MADYYNSVITKYNTDGNGNIVPKLIQNESIKVLANGIALLDEIPYKPYGVFISGYTEVSSGTSLTSTQFYVEYNGAGSGKIHFAVSEIGKHLLVTYKAIGKECIIASRIATEYTEDGDIVQSLEDYINTYIDVMDANRIHRQVKKYTATSPITIIPYASITGLTWNPAFDNLQIIRDNLILIEDENYSVDDVGITLYEALGTGESIFVIVFRGLLADVPAPSSDGSLLLSGSVGLTKLETLTQNKINAIPSIQSDLDDVIQRLPSTRMKAVQLYFRTDNTTVPTIQSIIDNTTLLNQLKTDGVTDIILIPVLVINEASSGLTANYSIGVLTNLINQLLGLGFYVSFKFHIENASQSPVLGAGNDLAYPSTFFSNYQTIVLNALAISQQIKMFNMLNEAPKVCSQYRSNWETLISAIRTQNSTIKLTCNGCFYDTPTCYIDLLDYIGGNFYPCGSNDETSSIIDFKKGWHEVVSKVNKLCMEYNKSYILTETGIVPKSYAGQHPSYYIVGGSWNIDNETVQANYYTALFEVMFNFDKCNGIWLWSASDGYTFVGKEAESVVSSYYGGA